MLELNDHVFSVRVPERFHAQLKEVAEAEHRTVANLIRVAAMEYVTKRLEAGHLVSAGGTEAGSRSWP